MMREEDMVVTSNGTNDDDYTNNNINSCSGSDNNRNGDANQISQVWGTWEELLLTCAVKRHGSKDWDSVAKEVGSRSSLDASAHDCSLKYQDLRRRFDDDDGQGNTDDRDGEIVERLRSLRVAELRREVQRRDESILSLQLKVKRLEEENNGDDGDDKPDLEDDSKAVRSLNNETEPVRLNRETTESDHRSMNESNSTASVADHERLNGDNSRNPDSAHKAADEGTVSRRSGTSHSGELGESGTSTGPRKRTKRGQKYISGEDSSIRGGSGGNIKTAGNKPQPLIEIIKLIRSHPRGSLFESRLRSQETKDYKGLIKQHWDIETIERKMEKGSYVSSSLSFYRDVKLLFTNAIVFFPASSSEYMAAQELRTLVSNEMKKKTGILIRSVIKAEAESSVSRQKPFAPPLVACKKKNPASKKTHPSSSLQQKDEKKTREVSEEKTVTTAARSSRRTSKGLEVVAKDTKMGRAKNNKKQKTYSSSDDDDGDKEETPKTEKKRAVAASEKKKSVAEFLKRIKTNSPQKVKETTSKDQKKSDGNVKKENSKAKPRELRSNSTGKKKVEVENNRNKSSSKRKQSKKEAEEVTDAGRENNQQPKKRNRR
ncbi:DNA-binding bromodomain-containing protein [Raphanus sativus]|uniref:Uncharacterized protein LOC108857648 n=1 Tax=Raphanus sativus TaxID=3726 RepID=A0A6J0NR42_RAPSA|nr:uncharacterized protein LOC108857648 [Raphanus sativus]XP_018487155.1 uncharacterized protein LOC108857648 [Raphanus sativus]KAJ4896240.1 DNA-binding bromodomain-containing protein [Raphanus sativus]